MALASTAIASALGITLGLLLEKAEFPGKRAVVRLCRTLMGTPPVAAGLVVYLLLMRRGSLDRVTAHAVYALCCSPLFNAAAMDGIATAGAGETTPPMIRGRDFRVVDTGDPIHPL